MKDYRILIDYGSEGMSFWDSDGFETLNEAVKEAQANSYGSKFYIVKIIKWEAKEQKQREFTMKNKLKSDWEKKFDADKIYLEYDERKRKNEESKISFSKWKRIRSRI